MIPNTLNKLKKIYRLSKTVNILDTSYELTSCDFLLFCHDGHRGVTLNNQPYSPLMDSLKDEIEEKNYTSITIAYPWSKIVGTKAYGHPIAINGSFFAVKLLDRVFKKSKLQPSVIFYEKLFKKAKPKIIITIGSPKELCEAARNLGIFHAELLHGIGYTLMKWDWDTLDKKHIPQCILSLDPVSTQTFSNLENKGVIVKEIAHPFLKRFQKHNIDKIPLDWRLSSSKNSSTKYDKEILVSLQWGYAPNIDELEIFKGTLPNGLFYKELEEAVEETKDSVFWRFRLHPVQYTQPEKYKEILDFMDRFVEKHPNCDWKESTFLPLPSILPICSGHITMHSMTSYEAAYFGIPTLALAPSLQEGSIYYNLLEDLVKSEYLIKKPVSLQTIIAWLENTKKKEPLLRNLFIEDEDIIEWLLLQSQA